MDRRDSTKKAMDRYFLKEMGKGSSREPGRKNKSPERDTQTAVMKWGRLNNFFLHVVEASIYDRRLGEARGEAKAEAGFSDVVGNTPTGLACYIELKAKDRRSTLSELQRRFLTLKIEQNCFAVVVDSADLLERYWKGFCSLKSADLRVAYLKDCLPKLHPQKGRKRETDDFEKAYGF